MVSYLDHGMLDPNTRNLAIAYVTGKGDVLILPTQRLLASNNLPMTNLDSLGVDVIAYNRWISLMLQNDQIANMS